MGFDLSERAFDAARMIVIGKSDWIHGCVLFFRNCVDEMCYIITYGLDTTTDDLFAMKKLYALLFATLTTPAIADVPRVVVDIAPIHALASQVMGDLGAPELLIEQSATPHSYALRPSQARALEQADLVLMTSEALTPWLHTPLESLAQEASVIELMLVEKARHHDLREDEEGDDHDHNHAHGEDDLDPHGWLDPDNAALWLGVIAAELATLDAENAEVYMANAERAVQEIEQLGQRLEAQLAQLKGKHYMVLHDGFQYFDRRFDIEFAGAIALGDASAPSPARIAGAREHLSEHNVACVFTEPQQNDRLVQVVIEGSDAKTAQLDALGAKLSPGPDLYSQLLQELADSFERCLGA